MKKLKFFGICAFLAAFLCSCSSKDAVVDLKAPLSVEEPSAQGTTVYIADVTDNRIFTGANNKYSTPSGTVLSKDYTKRAYARMKTATGQLGGGILLPKGKTVESVVRATIEQAFSDCGYNVVKDPALADESAIIAAVSIRKFWAWCNEEKVNIVINADIVLDIYTQTQDGQKHFMLKNTQQRQALTDTKAQYRQATEDSLSNIYYLATQKIKAAL
ncbi:MAG: hypothetical protein ACI4ND_03440 [Succinivibrio sp.]